MNDLIEQTSKEVSTFVNSVTGVCSTAKIVAVAEIMRISAEKMLETAKETTGHEAEIIELQNFIRGCIEPTATQERVDK